MTTKQKFARFAGMTVTILALGFLQRQGLSVKQLVIVWFCFCGVYFCSLLENNPKNIEIEPSLLAIGLRLLLGPMGLIDSFIETVTGGYFNPQLRSKIHRLYEDKRL